MVRRMPAEWEMQDGVLIAWPHAETDWRSLLDEVVPVFVNISSVISRKEKIVIVTPELTIVEELLITAGANMSNVRLYEFDTNDTWTRDYGPITVMEQSEPTLLNFGFNGWGLKFPAYLDNCITSHLYAAGAFSDLPLETVGLIMEGGSIESDGKGTILTTAECLLNQNRNPHLSREEIEGKLKQLLGAERILWLENGYLAGDDTDSHIDTLVRFAPEDTILYVACDNPEDEHFESLAAMREELKEFRTRDNRPYRLLPLPWPNAKYDDDGERLPATYANFLVINDSVLVPTYRDSFDETALDTIRRAFPGREIIGIDCLPLIYQHGSLHCITMQMTKGTLCKA